MLLATIDPFPTIGFWHPPNILFSEEAPGLAIFEDMFCVRLNTVIRVWPQRCVAQYAWDVPRQVHKACITRTLSPSFRKERREKTYR